MTSKSMAPYAVAALVLIGTVCVGLRFQARRDVRLGLADSVWRLRYSVEGEAEEPGAEFRVAFPAGTPHCRILRQDFRHSNLRIDSPAVARSGTSEVVAVAEEEGRSELVIRLDVYVSRRASRPGPEEPVSLSAEDQARSLESDDEIQTDSRVVRDTLARLRAGSAARADLVERLFEYCRNEIVSGGDGAPGDAAEALRQRTASPLGRVRAMTALCRAGGIPARLVAGFDMKEAGHAAPRIWLETLPGNRWVPYDPNLGFRGELPFNFLPVRHGGRRIFLARDMSHVEPEFSIARLPVAPQRLRAVGSHPLDILDLTRLPLEMHHVISVILLMPFGALVTCIFRNIVGLQTSGRFTPMLLALSFVFADWRTGIMVLVAVVLLGFTTRSLLDQIRLLMLPRLGIVLTLVVCCIVFGVSFLDYVRLTPGIHAVLLPMVILTMIVERFFVTAQEDGIGVAVQRLAATGVVGFFCYLVLRWEAVARLVLVYPEVHFFTVAVLIMIGRYTGYQLLEPWRFRDAVPTEP